MKTCKCSICVHTDGRLPTMTDDEAMAVCATPLQNIQGHRQWLAEQAAKPAPIKIATPAPIGSAPRPVFQSMIRGCGRCRELGRRCQQCRHDSY